MKKLLSTLLVISMLLSYFPMVFAAEISTSGGSNDVPVKLTQEITSFSVTIPTVLPVDVDTKGEVTVSPTNTITNNSFGPVEIKSVEIVPQNDWTLVDFETDFTEKKVGLTEFGFQINNANVAIDGTCEAKFDIIDGNSEIDFTYKANIAVQTNALEDLKIANVVFTVGWYETESETESYIYFNQPYTTEIDDIAYEYIFYENGSASIWMADAIAGFLPEGSVQYTETEIVLNNISYSISSNKTVLSNGQTTLTLKQTAEDSLKFGAYISDPYNLTETNGENGTFTLNINENSTVELNYNEETTIYTITQNNYTAILNDGNNNIECIIYPDGTKIAVFIEGINLEGMTFVSEDNFNGVQFGEFYSITTNGETVSYVFYENGSADLYQNGVLLGTTPEDYIIYTKTTITITGNSNILYISQDGTSISDGTNIFYLEIPCLHENTEIKNEEATCTTIGYNNAIVCTDCDKVISENSVIDALGHNWDKNNICLTCGESMLTINYAFVASDYDSKMNTTTATDENVVIPTSFIYNETIYNVTSIGPNAFKNCTNLVSIEIPSNITDIGESAFYGCTNLSLIELPSGITNINKSTFGGCTNLALTELPNGITNIGSAAFAGCTNLALTELPPNLTIINSAVFQNCVNLDLIELPNEITTINDYAFYNCTKLSLTELPENITSIGSCAFAYCKNLALTKLPANITTIHGNTFEECTNLALTELPSGITSIGGYAFAGCANITLSELPSGITSMGNAVFDGCVKITLTKLPTGITSIKNRTFANCTNIAITELPNGITDIGGSAFYKCVNLAITELPANITSIGSSAFEDCDSLISLTFKGTPSSIISDAFAYCSNLTTINVPWAEGEVADAPWSATNATVNYNYITE